MGVSRRVLRTRERLLPVDMDTLGVLDELVAGVLLVAKSFVFVGREDLTLRPEVVVRAGLNVEVRIVEAFADDPAILALSFLAA